MQIQLPPMLAVAAPAGGGVVAGWALNQVLTAEVIGITAANHPRLRIGAQTFTATTDVRLTVGQKLALRVCAVTPRPTLQMLATHTPAGPLEGALARGLARALPRLASTAQSVQVLNHFARTAVAPAAVAPARLPTTTQLAVRTLVRNWPAVAQVTSAGGLARVVDEARLPTEARLHTALATRSEPVLSGDLRAQLGRLQFALSVDTIEVVAHDPQLPARPSARPVAPASRTPAPALPPASTPAAVGPDSLVPDAASANELLDGVLARQTVQQLHNLAQQHAGGGAAAFAVEVPLTHASGCDLLRFDYTPEEPAGTDDAAPRRASVRVIVSLDDGRAISATIRLLGDAVSIRVGASEPALHAALAADLDELRARCSGQGLALCEVVMSAFDQLASAGGASRHGGLPLVDTRA